MQDTLLSLQHITKNFGEGDVLRDISLDVARGEFVTLLGASGWQNDNPAHHLRP